MPKQTNTKKYQGKKVKKLPTKKNLLVVAFAVVTLFGGIHPSVSAIIYQPWLTKMVFALGISLFLFFVSKKDLRGKTKKLKNPFPVLVFAYLFWMILSSFWNAGTLPNNTWKNQLLALAILIPISCLLGLFCGFEPAPTMRVLFIFGLIAEVHFLILLFLDPIFLEGPFRGLNRASPATGALYLTSNYFTTSIFIGLFGILLYGWSFHGDQGLQKLAILFLFSISTLSLCLTGSRAPLIAFISAVLFLFWIKLKNRQKKTRPCISLAFAAIPALGILIYLWFFQKGKLPLFTSLARIAELFRQPDQSTRLKMFGDAVRGWMESPQTLVFGHGLGGYGAKFAGPSEEAYPHNFFLETLHDGGLIGGTLLVFTGWFFIKKAFVKFPKPWLVPFDLHVLQALFLFFFLTWQVVGGIESLWLPFFFGALLYSAADTIGNKYG